jgi:hypothetical protein
MNLEEAAKGFVWTGRKMVIVSLRRKLVGGFRTELKVLSNSNPRAAKMGMRTGNHGQGACVAVDRELFSRYSQSTV